MLHARSCQKKPNDDEIKKMIRGFRTQWVSVGKLAYLLACGRTCRPGILPDGKTKGTDWQMQQCFFIDVENGITVSDALDICRKRGLVPNIIYPSFRYTPSAQRFRLVFVASEIIRDGALRDQIQEKLIALFHADRVTKDRVRIFFGGECCFGVDDRARMDVEKMKNRIDREKGGNRLAV